MATNNGTYYTNVDLNNGSGSDFENNVQAKPRRPGCKETCHWRFCLIATIIGLVLVGVGACAAFIFVYVIGSGDTCVIPKLTCAGNPPALTGYYNAKKEYKFGFTYLYSANFEQEKHLTFNDTSVTFGKMNLCVQTTGSIATGPYNCTLNYFYDHSNCAFHYNNGECDINVSHKYTDNMITDVQFDSATESLIFQFKSHSQITGGTWNMTRSDTKLITCDPASNAEPMTICPKTKMSFIESLPKLGL